MAEWVQIIIRSLFTIAILFLMTRILGKKQISQLTFFEYITGIVLGDLAGFMSTDINAFFIHGFVAILVWFTVPLTLELLTLKSKWMRDWFEGKGTIFIQEGKILEDNLKKERYTADELLEQLRAKNVFRVADVEFAVLEASGDLSVLLKKENQPVTPAQLGITTVREREPQTVIIDGNLMDEPLAMAGLSREWLFTELEKIGVTLENVFIGQVDSFGQLTVDLFDDKLQVPAPAQKPLLLATLKKCEADLALYSLAVDNRGAKRMYERCSEQTNRILKQIEPLLKT
ncbi:DUF421 domain-containing protein [Paenibacillus ehimensis]|uniref:DUF421 domain-containing protein n=1 Tax=Paenibacillus ehimensis TaxID=79264 RepID=UPI002DB92EF5|nr:DUF421 domain-containing protein [Paenibacillus ehimensis]